MPEIGLVAGYVQDCFGAEEVSVGGPESVPVHNHGGPFAGTPFQQKVPDPSGWVPGFGVRFEFRVFGIPVLHAVFLVAQGNFLRHPIPALRGFELAAPDQPGDPGQQYGIEDGDYGVQEFAHLVPHVRLDDGSQLDVVPLKRPVEVEEVLGVPGEPAQVVHEDRVDPVLRVEGYLHHLLKPGPVLVASAGHIGQLEYQFYSVGRCRPADIIQLGSEGRFFILAVRRDPRVSYCPLGRGCYLSHYHVRLS